MILVVDNGSTKADWCFSNSNGCCTISTTGINPIVLRDEQIKDIMRNQLLPKAVEAHLPINDLSAIFFYGAGCTDDKKAPVTEILRECINRNAHIEVESDLLGAARALCGHSEGIACILGTGANSCLFDGENIVAHTPALGYILGDEGSGAVLGRNFINSILKGALPHSICEDFLRESGYTVADILYNVYKGEAPNRFLASTSKFIHRYIDNEAVEQLVTDNFISFIEKNICPYHTSCTTLHAVGSIAFYYRPQLEKATKAKGYKIGKILNKPVMELRNYHNALWCLR